MKASNFNYHRPATLAAALSLLDSDNGDTQVLAGGQSLMPMMNFRLASPDTLVDLNALDDLCSITEHADAIEIGAMTRYSELLASPIIKQHLPLFTRAIPHIAHSAIRNRGTIGGSAALADPAAEMPALLKALDAHLLLKNMSGERLIAADDFFTGIYETDLADNEIIASTTIKKPDAGNAFGFYEVTRRRGDYAIAGVAISASASEPLRDLRVVFFGVSEYAVRAHACEQALEGSTTTNASTLTNAIAALSELNFVGDLHASVKTKQHMAGVVLQRALKGMKS